MASYLADQTKACYLAEAGVQETLAMLKQDPDYKYSSIWFDFYQRIIHLVMALIKSA